MNTELLHGKTKKMIKVIFHIKIDMKYITTNAKEKEYERHKSVMLVHQQKVQ